MRRLQITTALTAVLAFAATACAEAEKETDAASHAALSEVSSETSNAAESLDGAQAESEATGTQAAAAMPSPEDAAYDHFLANAPAEAWRTVEPENLLKITTSEGVVWVELASDWAPIHTARMRELARADWFDFKVWHRVLDNFMAQGGGALDNPNISAPTAPMPAEFTIRRDPNELVVTEIQERRINPRSNRSLTPAGFWNAMPVATQPAAAAAIMGDGRVDSWLIHCDGAAAMARTNDPNSANAQFYIVRGDAEHLNAQYTVWGFVREGLDVVYNLNIGTLGQNSGFNPSFIEDVEVAADLPVEDRPTIEVMDTTSQAFADYLTLLEDGVGELPDLCSIRVPTRFTE